jgi:hypothetical protein
MHGVSVAVPTRYACVRSGFRVTPPPRRSPYFEMIRAATPTACGDAIDVPWIHW